MSMGQVHVGHKVVVFLKRVSPIIEVLSKTHVTVRMIVFVDRYLGDWNSANPVFVFIVSLYISELVGKFGAVEPLPLHT